MSDKRWQQIEQLYHSALEKDEKDRPEFLASASGGDEELRREVESLLAYEDHAEQFIESPAVEVAARIMAQNARAKALAGQTINQYRIVEPLGAGGMGEVYLAEDTRLNRKVALKFLPQHLVEDKDHLRRFEQEARAIAGLSHPNVCTIHEVIETPEHSHCIVMEYVDGITLRERISKGRMNVTEALDVAIQIASALSAAHATGVVHRDIKLDNIMARRDGYVKVLDFGLAKLTERADSADSETETRKLSDRTTPGVVMGTVAYMSPEQARGLPVDSRTDLWSLGVVIYEMVSGQKPFNGKTPTDVIVSIASQEPRLLRSFSPDTPQKLDQIVRKALAKDAEQRYQTADDLLSDLKNLRRDLDIQPAGKTLERSSSRVFSRNRVLIGSAIVVMLIVAGFVYTRFSRERSVTAPPSEVRSLAVLPLENLSGDQSQEYFADGMTDALITDLAKIGALRVISRPTVMQYKGVRKPLTEIGQELKVDAILTGTVMRSGEQVRISVELFQIATEETRLWADSYDRAFRDLLALQRDVTQDIVGKIRIQLTPQEQGRIRNVRAVNPEAYDEYLRGKFYLNHQDQQSNEAAIQALQNAVSKDDSFAAAHAELAQAYVWKLFLFSPNEPQWAVRAYAETNKALQLDPDSAVAYLARGRLQWTPANSFPHEKAIQDYKRALQLDPNLDEARNQLALVYSHIGALDESLRESQKAIDTNPTNNLAQFRIGETLNFEGKYEQGLSALRGIPPGTNPELVGQQIVWSLFNLGQREEAASKLEQLLKDYPDDRGLLTSLQAVLAASGGQHQVAEEKIKLAVSRGKGFGHFHHTTYYIACAYALMNKTDQAMKWLEATADDGFPCYPMFEHDKNLNSLRKDPRFEKFLERQRKRWEDSRSWL